MQIFYWHFILFNFGINTGVVILKVEFENDAFHRKIQLFIWKIWMISKFFQVTGGIEDTWLDRKTKYRHMTEQKMHRKFLAISFCPWDFRTFSCPGDRLEHGWNMARACLEHAWNMAGKWLGNFQLITCYIILDWVVQNRVLSILSKKWGSQLFFSSTWTKNVFIKV